MSIVKQFLGDSNGKMIISIIWGLGLSALFRKVCKGRNCIVIKREKKKKIENKIFKVNNKCIKFNSEITSCNSKV